MMKIRIYEITQTKYSDSRGSMGFTSVCFAFAVGVLFISPPRTLYAEHDGAAFPEQGPLQPALAWQPSAYYQDGQIVVADRERDWQGQGPQHLAITFTLWWHKLKTSVLSPMPLSLPLTLLLLAFSWTFCLTGGLVLANSPTSHAFQAENTLNLQHLTTSPTHVPFIPIMRILISPFRPTFGPFNNTGITSTKQSALKIWPLKNINSARERQSYRKIFPIVNFCYSCVMLAHWNLIAKGL